MKIVKDNYAEEQYKKTDCLCGNNKHKGWLDEVGGDMICEDCEDEYLETKCEDCGIINCEDFSYYENRCGDCCYKKDMRNREYEREQKNIRQKKINELDRQIDLRGVELLEIIQGLGTELKNKYETREEGKLLIKQAIEIGNILDKIAFREDGRL